MELPTTSAILNKQNPVNSNKYPLLKKKGILLSTKTVVVTLPVQ
jgi:hypothetical protein